MIERKMFAYLVRAASKIWTILRTSSCYHIFIRLVKISRLINCSVFFLLKWWQIKITADGVMFNLKIFIVIQWKTNKMISDSHAFRNSIKRIISSIQDSLYWQSVEKCIFSWRCLLNDVFVLCQFTCWFFRWLQKHRQVNVFIRFLQFETKSSFG